MCIFINNTMESKCLFHIQLSVIDSESGIVWLKPKSRSMDF